MISPVFVLCSVLLITGTIAERFVEKFYTNDKAHEYSTIDWNDHIFSDTKKQMKETATNFGMNLFTDLMNGKNIKDALTER